MESPAVSDQGKQSPTSNGDGESSQDSAMEVKIKDEPVDSGYEPTASNENRSSSDSRASSPPSSSQHEAASPTQDQDGSSISHSEDQQTPRNTSSSSPSIRSNAEKKDVQNIVEGLLKKNATLLAMNDAEGYKPNSRRKGLENSINRGEALGQSTVFPISKSSQARLVASHGHSDKGGDFNRSCLLRPKSPTRKCDFIFREDNQLTYALMEANICDTDAENVFSVQHHELVCAVLMKSYVTDKDKKIVAVLDSNHYWCNFCSFSSTNKDLLAQHVLDHRFRCNHCPYESFCRSDIIRHMSKSHSEFSSSADSYSYCTFLSDYLRVKSRSENVKKKSPCIDPDDDVDDLNKDEMQAAYLKAEKRKREFEPDISDLPDKRARLEDDPKSAETSDTVHDRQGKSRKSQNPRRHPQPNESDYDTFEMEVEEINDYAENGNEHNSERMKVMYPSRVSEDTHNMNKPLPSSLSSSRMQVLPSLQEGGKQGFTTTHIPNPVPSRLNRPINKTPNTSPFNKNKRASGASSLYWGCGYCDFQGNSQAEIKEHSNRNHPGNPRMLVALIKKMNQDTVINKNIGKNTTSSNRSPASNTSNDPSSKRNFSSVKVTPTSGDGRDKVGRSDDVVPLKEDSDTGNLLKVKLNPMRNARKETTVYRCYHCPYTARRHSAMKSHIYYKHRGKGLLAVDEDSNTGEKVFFCARDDCTFKSVSAVMYLNHVDQCTPWHKPELADVEVEPHIRECLQQTITFAELSRETEVIHGIVTEEQDQMMLDQGTKRCLDDVCVVDKERQTTSGSEQNPIKLDINADIGPDVNTVYKERNQQVIDSVCESEWKDSQHDKVLNGVQENLDSSMGVHYDTASRNEANSGVSNTDVYDKIWVGGELKQLPVNDISDDRERECDNMAMGPSGLSVNPDRDHSETFQQAVPSIPSSCSSFLTVNNDEDLNTKTNPREVDIGEKLSLSGDALNVQSSDNSTYSPCTSTPTLKLTFKTIGEVTTCSINERNVDDASGGSLQSESPQVSHALIKDSDWSASLMDSDESSDFDIDSNPRSTALSVSSISEIFEASTGSPFKDPDIDNEEARTKPDFELKKNQSIPLDSDIKRPHIPCDNVAAKSSEIMGLTCVPARSAAVKAMSKMKPNLEVEATGDNQAGSSSGKKLSVKCKQSHMKPSCPIPNESNMLIPSPSAIKSLYSCRHCSQMKAVTLPKIKSHMTSQHPQQTPVVTNIRQLDGGRKIRKLFLCLFPLCKKLVKSATDLDRHRLECHNPSVPTKPKERKTMNSLSTSSVSSISQVLSPPTQKTIDHKHRSASLSDCSVQLQQLNMEQLSQYSDLTIEKTTSAKYECLYCTENYSSETLSDMKQHYFSEHASQLLVMRDVDAKKSQLPSRIYVCDDSGCDFKSSCRADILSHASCHSVNCTSVYECPSCGWYSSSFRVADDHVKEMHADEHNISLIRMQLSVDDNGQTSKKILR